MSKESTWKWKGARIEEVKKFKYLGYTLRSNNDDSEHIRDVTCKANTGMGIIWSIGERLFTENWDRRMRLFDALSRSIAMYGAEIWGWKEFPEIERLQTKYIKWTTKLGRSTPNYLVRKETQRDKLAIKAATRALKFEIKLMKEEEGSLRKECWKLLRKEGKETKLQKERKKFLNSLGWSQEVLERKLAENMEVWKETESIARDQQRQEEEAKLRDSKYAQEIRAIVCSNLERPEYLRKNHHNRRGELSTMARYRLGNEAKATQYWRSPEERRCRLCGEEEETLKHIFENCTYTRREGPGYEEILRSDGKYLARMLEIGWKRKRQEGNEGEEQEEEGHAEAE